MNPPAVKPVLLAGDALAERLKIFKKLSQQARDCGDTEVVLPIQAVWEQSDNAALATWEAQKAQFLGQRSLFGEVSE
jgi:hypothetical protein